MPGDKDTEDKETSECCNACGGDHETQHCETEFCANCGEILENCDCENPKVTTGDRL